MARPARFIAALGVAGLTAWAVARLGVDRTHRRDVRPETIPERAIPRPDASEQRAPAPVERTLKIRVVNTQGALLPCSVYTTDASGRASNAHAMWPEVIEIDVHGPVDAIIRPEAPYAPRLVEDLRPGSEPVTVRVRKGKTLSGVIVNQDDRAATEIRLEFIDKARGIPIEAPMAYTVYGADGEQVGGGWSDGRCRARFSRPPCARFTIEVEAAGYRPSGPVTMRTGTETTRELRLELVPDPGAFGVLTLIVSDRAGLPADTLQIDADLVRRRTVRGTHGEFELKVPAGRRTLTLDSPTDDFLEVKPCWLDQDLDLTIGRGEHVVRRVVMERGAWIRLVPHPSSIRLSEHNVRLSRRGEDVDPYLIRHKGRLCCLVPAGPYELEATEKSETVLTSIDAVAGEVTDAALRFSRER